MTYNERKELWSDLLGVYCKFIEHDIFTSLKHQRNFPFIRKTITILHQILNRSNVKAIKTLLNMLKGTKHNRADYEAYWLNDTFCKPLDHNSTKVYSLLDEKMETHFKELLISYDLALKTNEKMSENCLNEFHNAMSHIVASILSTDEKIKDINIKRANSHLKRGILDGYKVALSCNMDKIFSNEKWKKMFFYVRKRELMAIGADEKKDKDFDNMYYNLAITITD